ncbi:Crp/Fnr family transcriptional regulator [soil metagenome]
MSESCFAARLKKYMALTPGEIRALEQLEENPRHVRKGQVIQREKDIVTELFVVSSGRMMNYVILPDGQRQILRIHFPGDFIGAASTAYSKAPESLAALTDGVLCPFDKHALRRLIQDHPRVAALMFVISQTERVALTDRLTSMGRASAKSRLASFLLDIIDRLRVADDDIKDSFELRLTQEEIGDAVGLTSVHVNRMIRQLENEGLIARSNGSITLLDEARLQEIGHYTNRYEDLDVDWLPTS